MIFLWCAHGHILRDFVSIFDCFLIINVNGPHVFTPLPPIKTTQINKIQCLMCEYMHTLDKPFLY